MRWFRHHKSRLRSGFAVVCMVVLAGCASAKYQQELTKAENGDIFWAVETTSTLEGAAVNAALSDFVQDSSTRYAFWPGFFAPGPRRPSGG